MSSSRFPTPAASKTLLTHLAVAGTAALATSHASAQIIVTPVNIDVGYGMGGQLSFTSSLPGLSQFTIYRGDPANISHFVSASGTSGRLTPNAYLAFKTTRTSNNILNFFEVVKSPAGQKFGSAPGTISTSAGFAGILSFGPGHAFYRGYAPFTDGYFLFEFADTTNGNQLDYGYINASLTDDTFNGLNLHINSYVYDLSGNQIAAGQLPTDVPEPSTSVAFAALGALTLGAAGVRRMKALQA